MEGCESDTSKHGAEPPQRHLVVFEDTKKKNSPQIPTSLGEDIGDMGQKKIAHSTSPQIQVLVCI